MAHVGRRRPGLVKAQKLPPRSVIGNFTRCVVCRKKFHITRKRSGALQLHLFLVHGRPYISRYAEQARLIRKANRRYSRVWKLFTTRLNLHKCKLCDRILRCATSSGLTSHMRHCHKTEYEELRRLTIRNKAAPSAKVIPVPSETSCHSPVHDDVVVVPPDSRDEEHVLGVEPVSLPTSTSNDTELMATIDYTPEEIDRATFPEFQTGVCHRDLDSPDFLSLTTAKTDPPIPSHVNEELTAAIGAIPSVDRYPVSPTERSCLFASGGGEIQASTFSPSVTVTNTEPPFIEVIDLTIDDDDLPSTNEKKKEVDVSDLDSHLFLSSEAEIIAETKEPLLEIPGAPQFSVCESQSRSSGVSVPDFLSIESKKADTSVDVTLTAASTPAPEISIQKSSQTTESLSQSDVIDVTPAAHRQSPNAVTAVAPGNMFNGGQNSVLPFSPGSTPVYHWSASDWYGNYRSPLNANAFGYGQNFAWTPGNSWYQNPNYLQNPYNYGINVGNSPQFFNPMNGGLQANNFGGYQSQGLVPMNFMNPGIGLPPQAAQSNAFGGNSTWLANVNDAQNPANHLSNNSTAGQFGNNDSNFSTY